jgi:hypothetical protein
MSRPSAEPMSDIGSCEPFGQLTRPGVFMRGPKSLEGRIPSPGHGDH